MAFWVIGAGAGGGLPPDDSPGMASGGGGGGDAQPWHADDSRRHTHLYPHHHQPYQHSHQQHHHYQHQQQQQQQQQHGQHSYQQQPQYHHNSKAFQPPYNHHHPSQSYYDAHDQNYDSQQRPQPSISIKNLAFLVIREQHPDSPSSTADSHATSLHLHTGSPGSFPASSNTTTATSKTATAGRPPPPPRRPATVERTESGHAITDTAGQTHNTNPGDDQDNDDDDVNGDEHGGASGDSFVLLDDLAAAQLVRDHVANFHRRCPDSQHARILRALINPKWEQQQRRRCQQSSSRSQNRRGGQRDGAAADGATASENSTANSTSDPITTSTPIASSQTQKHHVHHHHGREKGPRTVTATLTDPSPSPSSSSPPSPPPSSAFPLDNDALCSVFSAANELFFANRLARRVAWDWSHPGSPQYDHAVVGTTALRRCAPLGGWETLIVLSSPVLRDTRYNRRLLLSTFLHEMIHSFLFVTCGRRAGRHGGHTPGFRQIADIIDAWVGREFLRLGDMEADLQYFEDGAAADVYATPCLGFRSLPPSQEEEGQQQQQQFYQQNHYQQQQQQQQQQHHHALLQRQQQQVSHDSGDISAAWRWDKERNVWPTQHGGGDDGAPGTQSLHLMREPVLPPPQQYCHPDDGAWQWYEREGFAARDGGVVRWGGDSMLKLG